MSQTIAKEIMELRELKVPELLRRYEEVFGKSPRIKRREWLWRRIAWKIQENRFGGLSVVAKHRLEELISEIDLPLAESQRSVSGAFRKPRKPGEPPIGTTLLRQWHGRQIEVRVVDEGYELDGVVFRSLSALAEAVTGAHWSGRLFFGLTKRKRRRG